MPGRSSTRPSAISAAPRSMSASAGSDRVVGPSVRSEPRSAGRASTITSSFDSYPSACGTSVQRRTRSSARSAAGSSATAGTCRADCTPTRRSARRSRCRRPARPRVPGRRSHRIESTDALRPHLAARGLERATQGARHLAAAADRPPDRGRRDASPCRARRGPCRAPPARSPTPSARTSPRGR